MADEYTTKMLEATSRRKRMLDAGEALLKEKRIELGVEEYFDMDVLLDSDARVRANDVLKRYLDHLSVVESFYTEFHRTFVEEVVEISQLLTSEERAPLLRRATIGLEKNNRIRIRINEISVITATKIQKVIEIFDSNEVTDDAESDSILLYSDQDIEEFEGIMSDIEQLDAEAVKLVKLQKKNNMAGQALIAGMLGFFRK